nr:MAG TPA: hypothetical protein [Caudoviricetes sp.]
MKRLTTNCPDNNLDAALNLFYIKDFETWVRGGGDGPDYPDIRLYDFIRKAAKILLPDLDFPMDDDDGVDYAMGELLLDGPDEPTGLLALLYTAAWSYAELRGRLMQYEDTGKTPVEVSTLVKDWNDLCAIVVECGGVSRVRVLAEADKSGRLVVLPCKVGGTLWVTGRDNVPREMELEAPDIRAVCTDEDNLCMSTCNRKPDGFCAYRLRNDGADIGKTVFLTREEADKALEAMKDD